MSKPKSGLFTNTTGFRNDPSITSKGLNSPEETIASRVTDYDLNEHPIPYTELSSKKIKTLSEKEAKRILTKSEYRHREWYRRFSNRKARGIDAFWRQERKRILKGLPTTRNWSASQIQDIINKKKPKYDGHTMQSHHTYSAAKYPHLADKGEVIYPATPYEHRHSWHGGNYKQSLPGKPIYNKEYF